MASLLKRMTGSRKSGSFSPPGVEIGDMAVKRLDISGPTDFKHQVHVGFDPDVGFVGIPAAWDRWLETSTIRYGSTVLAAGFVPR